ncbi:hypothetical protein A4X09_0g5902 [Tilletia walkeri]|uniref:Uncharacterized protein n=1 Tax=Tilletia walkeri TaxID=117179 RepID=A0A8X7N4U3_9BASI|nr:hypothetical protein A4X09_0g5902 [Tilletia walkeri]
MVSQSKANQKVRRCARGCKDPKDSSVRLPLPCAHNKSIQTPSSNSAAIVNDSSAAAAHEASSVASPAPDPTAVALPAAAPTAAGLVDSPAANFAAAGPIASAINTGPSSVPGPALSVAMLAAEAAAAAASALSAFSSGEGTLETEIRAPSPFRDNAMPTYMEPGDDDNGIGDGENSEIGGGGSPEPELALDLARSQEYALKHFKYESNADERVRVIKRGVWRLIEQGAKLSRRTDLAVVVAVAPLDNGKSSVADVVYVSPNLCDTARPALRSMAEDFQNEFKQTMHKYREAGRVDVGQQLQANKKLMAEKAKLQDENAQLRAQLRRLAPSTSSSSTNTASSLVTSAATSAATSSPFLQTDGEDQEV